MSSEGSSSNVQLNLRMNWEQSHYVFIIDVKDKKSKTLVDPKLRSVNCWGHVYYHYYSRRTPGKKKQNSYEEIKLSRKIIWNYFFLISASLWETGQQRQTDATKRKSNFLKVKTSFRVSLSIQSTSEWIVLSIHFVRPRANPVVGEL